MNTNIKTVVFAILLWLPVISYAEGREPYLQKFMITAYYSPLPDQCCYVKGGYEADQYLNGQGYAGADGTNVYAGMAAAPGTYAFGTVIELPGIGTVKVHDRGGAIVEKEDGVHRLDLWVGHGEEGLARALDFGVQRVEATVYPNGADQPSVSLNLKDMSADIFQIAPYQMYQLYSLRPEYGDYSYSTFLLQQNLKEAGYFYDIPNASFGDKTKNALSAFIEDFSLDEPSEQLSEKTAAYLMAAVQRKGITSAFLSDVNADSTPEANAAAKRTLSSLGFYRGRMNENYDDKLKDAILSFQQKHKLVGTKDDPGAGRIGPKTLAVLQHEWNKTQVASRANLILTYAGAEKVMAQNGELLSSQLHEGYSGTQVSVLQKLLTYFGFFPEEESIGYFGRITQDAVASYQLSRGLISSKNSNAAGVVGPKTLNELRAERRQEIVNTVRSYGWNAL